MCINKRLGREVNNKRAGLMVTTKIGVCAITKIKGEVMLADSKKDIVVVNCVSNKHLGREVNNTRALLMVRT